MYWKEKKDKSKPLYIYNENKCKYPKNIAQKKILRRMLLLFYLKIYVGKLKKNDEGYNLSIFCEH